VTRRDQYPHFAPLTAAVSVLAARPDVTLAYVFGSTARGERRADSDIDIAVLFDVQPSATEQLALRDALCAAAQIPVDLVVLNDASPLLAHEVISEGRALLVTETAAQALFEMRAIAFYLDTAHLRNVQLDYLRERVKARTHAG